MLLELINEILSEEIIQKHLWLSQGKPVLSPIYKYQEMLVLNIQSVVACQWW